MRREESRVLDRISFNGGERFGSVRHSRGVAQINESFVWQMFMQCAIDGQSTNAAIEDADRQVSHEVSTTRVSGWISGRADLNASIDSKPVRTACGSGRANLNASIDSEPAQGPPATAGGSDVLWSSAVALAVSICEFGHVH